MKYRVRKSLTYILLVVAFLFYAPPAFAIILHPGQGEPNPATWTDRPDPNVVGRWNADASFVVVAPNWLLTTRHQYHNPASVTIDGTIYTCHYNNLWSGGPQGNADIRLVRLTRADGTNPNLAHYAPPYPDDDEVGQEVVIGGYGDGRGAILKNRGITYGYKWDNSTNTTLRLGTNKIGDTENDSAAVGFTSDILIADFDGLNEGDSTDYEAVIGDHDSGGGWFIYDGQQWRVAGLSRLVEVHYEQGHEEEPEYIESWFRNRDNPTWLWPDYFDAVRVSSYAQWIGQTIHVEADLTADDWVDFADFAVLAAYWSRDDCGPENNFCQGADCEPTDGSVDWNDLLFLADKWLTGWQY